MMIAKRIAVVIGAATLAFLWCAATTAAAQNGTISGLMLCRDIGNKTGAGSLTCIGENGHDLGKGGSSFRQGDQIFVLVRFRNLPVDTHRVTVTYLRRAPNGKYESFRNNSRTLSMKNQTPNWSFWFPAHFKDVNQYEIIVGVKFPHATVRRHKKYCVGCPGE